MLYKLRNNKNSKDEDKRFVIDITPREIVLNDTSYYLAQIHENTKSLRINFWINQEHKITSKEIAELNGLTPDSYMKNYWFRPYHKGFMFYIAKHNIERLFIQCNQEITNDIYDTLENILCY